MPNGPQPPRPHRRRRSPATRLRARPSARPARLRRGVPVPVPLAALFATAVAVLVGSGCAGTAVRTCVDAPALLLAAPGDSLAIDPFLRLDPAAQAARRASAADLRLGARVAREPAERVRLAAAAAAAAPDDPDLWLEAGAAWRAVGDQLQTGAALDAAAAAVRRLNDPGAPLGARGAAYRRQAVLATALGQAWHHYERSEWADADDWALAALRVEPGSPGALQVRGLVQGRLGQTPRVLEIAAELGRRDMFTPYARWIQAAHEESLDRLRGALDYYLELRPDQARALECYRDMGAVAERLREWTLAAAWYAKSAAASPLAGDPCLARADLPPLDPGPAGSPARMVPVWLALDRHYVTGSLSAYARHAFERFEASPPGADRDLWAGLAVNAAGILLRRDADDHRALRLRGLVFAAAGSADLAGEDLRRASAAIAAARLPGDARIEAELGRLHLGREEYPLALPRLRRAVELEPAAAGAWADLGMALARTGDAPGALAALDRAIELAPDRPTPWYNRGLLHMHAQRIDEAERDLGRAAQLAPDNGDIARLLQQVRLARSRVRTPGANP